MKKLLTVVLTLLLVGCASVPPAENVSYPVQTEENVQNNVQNSEVVQESGEDSTISETVDAPIVEEAVEEDVSINDDYGSDNESEPVESQKRTESSTVLPTPEPTVDSREDAKTEEPEVIDAPIVEEFALSREIVDDTMCKFRENSWARNQYPNQLAASFPALNHANSLKLSGTLLVQVVFIEWDNLSGTQADYDYHIQQLRKFEDFYYMVSEGKLNIEFQYSSGWLNVGSDYVASSIPAGKGGGDWRNREFLQGKLDVWVAATDSAIDYSDNKVAIFAVPRAKNVIDEGAHEFGHAPGAYIKADGVNIYNWFAGGTRFMTPGQEPLWVFYAHEFGHSLGIPDLRDMTDSYKTGSVIRGEKWLVNPMGDMDIMDNQGGPTRTINAWTRWVQGWVSNSQVTCVIGKDVGGAQYYKINQLNKVGAETKSLVIKTSETTALIIESRRWDSRFDVPIQHSRNGIVVYRLDSTKGHEEGPLRLYSPRDITKYKFETTTWPDPRCLDVFLYEGQTLTAQGFTIKFEAMRDSGDVVKIYRSN